MRLEYYLGHNLTILAKLCPKVHQQYGGTVSLADSDRTRTDHGALTPSRC